MSDSSVQSTVVTPTSQRRESRAVLRRKIREGYIWTAAGTMGRHGITFGLSILLARMLGPADYGLIGMVTVFTGILAVLQDFGIGQARICLDDDESALPTYYTASVMTGIAMTAVGFLGAPLVALFYHEPRLTPLTQWLSLALAFGGLRSVSQAILTKRFRFREVMFIEVTASAAGGCLAVILAWAGWGAWSLVVNLLLFEVLRTLLFCIVVPPRFSVSIQMPVLRKLVRWGLPQIGGTFLWQFYDNADYMIVGKTLGPVPLGLYTLAFRFATLVNQRISPIVNRVSLPSFAAMQQDRKALLSHWFSLTRKLALVNFPLLAALFVGGDDLIRVALGEKWIGAIVPLRLLCVVGVVRTVSPVMHTMCAAMQRNDLGFQYNLVNAICLPPAFYFGSKYFGLYGLGLAWTLSPAIFYVQLRRVLRLLGASFLDYLRNLRYPFIVTTVCFVSMLPAKLLSIGAFPRLCVLSALGLVVYGACIMSHQSIRQRILGLPFISRSSTKVGNQ